MSATTPEWDQERIQRMIDGKIEEGSSIEYKAAAALENADEITKDVSAFANAAGGTIVYGVKEFAKPKNHLPEKIDPIDMAASSKERLDQIICTIAPKIEGVQIIPVPVGPGRALVCYVVEVPQGATAHQARDCKYYRRYNFQNLPMLDHEIRDVMGRRKYPKLEFKLSVKSTMDMHLLVAVRIWNKGPVVPQRYGTWVLVPTIFEKGKVDPGGAIHFLLDGRHYWKIFIAGETPLFPASDTVIQSKFRYELSKAVPEPAGDRILCTLYADDMPSVPHEIPASTTQDWT